MGRKQRRNEFIARSWLHRHATLGCNRRPRGRGRSSAIRRWLPEAGLTRSTPQPALPRAALTLRLSRRGSLGRTASWRRPSIPSESSRMKIDTVVTRKPEPLATGIVSPFAVVLRNRMVPNRVRSKTQGASQMALATGGWRKGSAMDYNSHTHTRQRLGNSSAMNDSKRRACVPGRGANVDPLPG
jgi:hypothetical protein